MNYTMKFRIMNVREMSRSDYELYYSLMTDERKKIINKYCFEKDKKLSVCGEMLAKQMIFEQCGINIEDIVIEKDENGKPYVKNADIHFNISHAAAYVVCVQDEMPVGIDIEQIRDIQDSLIRYVCAEQELHHVYAGRDEEDKKKRFFEIWTAKEAYFKCIGTGITDLKGINTLDELIRSRLTTFYYDDCIINIYR